MIQADLNIILPELVLSLFAMGALVFAVYTGKDRMASMLTWATSAVLVAVGVWIGISGDGTQVAFGGMFVDDGFARFAKVVILLSAAAVLMMSEGYMKARGLLRFEYPMLIALAAVGMMMMVSAGDLMALYMGLELQSLALYVVASLRRDSVKSTEAGLKYFVLGALSSGLLLYGASLVYGYAGTTLFSGIIQTAVHGEVSLGLLFGLVFLISGMAFKVSAVPFHNWAPDTYEGAPTPITGFMAAAVKAAGFGVLVRVVQGVADLPPVFNDLFPWQRTFSLEQLGQRSAAHQSHRVKVLTFALAASVVPGNVRMVEFFEDLHFPFKSRDKLGIRRQLGSQYFKRDDTTVLSIGRLINDAHAA